MDNLLLGVWYLLQAYLVLLWARFIFDIVTTIIAPHWRPSGFFLVAANVVYGLTDPPLRFVRKYVKPVRIGQVALDLGFIIVMIAVIVLQRIVFSLIVAM